MWDSKEVSKLGESGNGDGSVWKSRRQIEMGFAGYLQDSTFSPNPTGSHRDLVKQKSGMIRFMLWTDFSG